MRASVDVRACTGHALCYSVAPDVYDLDDSGHVLAPGPIPAGRERDAENGAAACPERAISVVAD
jgi:ferredoxin